MKDFYTLSYIIKSIIKDTVVWVEVNNNACVAAEKTVAKGQVSGPEVLMRSKCCLS